MHARAHGNLHEWFALAISPSLGRFHIDRSAQHEWQKRTSSRCRGYFNKLFRRIYMYVYVCMCGNASCSHHTASNESEVRIFQRIRNNKFLYAISSRPSFSLDFIRSVRASARIRLLFFFNERVFIGIADCKPIFELASKLADLYLSISTATHSSIVA